MMPSDPQEPTAAVDGLQYQDFASLQEERIEPDLPAAFAVPGEDLPATLEALVFASGEPIGLERLCEATGVEKDRIRRVLREMEERMESDRRCGVMLRSIEDAWFLSTKPMANAALQRLLQPRNRPPLSQAAYETLAIVAYNQPATRSQIESIRGVGSDSIVSRLIERGLVKEAGTLDAPGRPTLFETTDTFLQEFGLRSVHELPSMEMMMYGTLRDIEVQLEEAVGVRKDNQITIEQIAPVTALSPEIAQEASVTDAGELLELSGAIFGNTGPEEGADPDSDPDPEAV